MELSSHFQKNAKKNNTNDLIVFCIVFFLHLLLFYLLYLLLVEIKPVAEKIEFQIVNIGDVLSDSSSSEGAPKASVNSKTQNLPKPTTPKIDKPIPKPITPPKPIPKVIATPKASPSFKQADTPVPAKTIEQPKQNSETAELNNGKNSTLDSANTGSGTAKSSGVGEGFKKGSYVKIRENIYPQLSRQNEEQGVVRVNVSVSANGEVTSASVVKSSGYSRLDEAAINTAKTRYKYKPNSQDGKPQNSIFTFNIIFNLNN